ncbi:glycoside hydrolase family 2 protein [Isoptericola sp. 4D.3]|uniref:beta-mannosidase n=1 Tax=Isoptericola peretonis TaxID=2918523 RepID=A0ABT0J570_9MICO|nr:glycoside hydrolase family 2 protein [Isoptericola sp. 4D.3]
MHDRSPQGTTAAGTVHRVDLGGPGWTVRWEEGLPAGGAGPSGDVVARLRDRIPASVPGCVHDDLLAAGVIADPYVDDNAAAVRWVGESDWVYEADVELTDAHTAGRVELVLDGLATVATVRVNGREAVATANMHRSYAVDVSALVRLGVNRLAVELSSAARAMLDADDGTLPYDWAYPYNRLRVMASSVGWDWAPPLVSAGLWRPARIEAWSGVRLRSHARGEVSADLAGRRVVVAVELDGQDGGVATGEVELGLGGHRSRHVVTGRDEIVLDVPDAELWWPHGYGAATLHDVTVSLVGTDQEQTHRVGLRHVDLDTTPDATGRRFVVVVNGREIFALGANWIPDELLVSRMTAERYVQRVDQAVAANMNMLRVWGGGVYEDDAFYSACDAAGVLVWQDFAFACAAYPEEEPLRSEVEAEAREQVRRLAAHPSVVVWNGSNENLQGWSDWGWPERVGTRTWGEGYYRELLPRVVAAEAPGTPYVPSSPFSSTDGVGPNVDGEGTSHLWDQWNLYDYTTYRHHVPRFAAELGFQAPPTWATLSAALTERPVDVRGAALATRQRQVGGMRHLLRRLDGHVPDPDRLLDDVDDWSWATQLNQAEALRTAADHLRGSWPRTAGMLVWQLNDAWPGISWSVVDHGGRPKPGWHALRRAYAPRTLSIQAHDGAPRVVLVNDTDAVWQASVVVRRVHVVGGPLGAPAEAEQTVVVAPRSVARWDVPPQVALAGARRDEVLVADCDGLRAWSALCREDGVRWARPAPTVEASRTPQGWRVRITADVVTCDVALLVDRLDPAARVDDLLTFLLPGETVELDVTGAEAADPAAFGARPVLRTRNDLWHR